MIFYGSYLGDQMLRAENISFSYHKSSKSVLENITIYLKHGQLFGLIGPNGSGKSTLTKIMMGLIKPVSGEISIYNHKQQKSYPVQINNDWKQNIGYISGATTKLFQNSFVNEQVRIYDSLYRNFDMNIFNNYVSNFNLTTDLNKKITQFSFGERIKLETALTLAYNPQILFLDEPTVGLDPLAVDEIRNALKEYVISKNATGLITSHNLKDIEHLCEEGAFLLNGTLHHQFNTINQKSTDLESRYKEIYGKK